MLSFDSPVQTPWHRLPVGLKFFVVLLSTLLLFIFDSVLVQSIALLACITLYTAGGREFLLAGAKRLIFIWPFLLVILVWHLVSGTVTQGMVIALRLVAILGISNLLTMTSKLSDLLGLIHKALSPFRAIGVNTRPVEIAVALFIRFTPIFIGKGAALGSAWKMRSAKKPGWRIVFPLSLVAIDDAEQVAAALKARGGTVQHIN